MNRIDLLTKTLRAVRSAAELDIEVDARHSFVRDLGFDSLRMATLALCLEEELGCAILLNDWIAGAEDPANLTVASLAEYVSEQLAVGAAA
jgi:acyl carrier protein